MARSRSSRREHITKTKVATGHFETVGDSGQRIERYNYTAWCGETSWAYERTPPYSFAEYGASANACTKCQSKKLAAELKANPIPYELAERVNAKDEENPYGVSRYGWKSVYPVIDTRILADDERDRVVGFVMIPTGWGEKWEFRTWEGQTRHADKEPREPKPSSAALRYKTPDTTRLDGSISEGYHRDTKRFSSKEEALMIVPLLSEQGLLKTRQGIMEDNRQWLARLAVQEREREIERARNAEERERRQAAAERERDALLADLREVLAEELPNFTRDVIFRVARKAGFTEADLSAPRVSATGKFDDDFDPKRIAA